MMAKGLLWTSIQSLFSRFLILLTVRRQMICIAKSLGWIHQNFNFLVGRAIARPFTGAWNVKYLIYRLIFIFNITINRVGFINYLWRYGRN